MEQQSSGDSGDSNGRAEALARTESMSINSSERLTRGVHLSSDYDRTQDVSLRFIAIDNCVHLDYAVIQNAVSYPILKVVDNILCVACIGDTELLDYIGFDGTDQRPAGLTPLWLAAWNNHLDMVTLILERGYAKVDSAVYSGITPLMIAAAEGHLTMVKLLLEKGAKADIYDMDGRYAYSHAEDNGHEEVMNLLKKNPGRKEKTGLCESNRNEFIRAAGLGDEKTVSALLRKNKTLSQAPDDSSCLPIIAAAASGCNDIVKLLIDAGADINARWADITSMKIAAQRMHHDTVRLLLEKKVQMDHHDENSVPKIADEYEQIVTLLNAAHCGNVSKVIELLEQVSIDRAEDIIGRSALWYAAASGNVGIVKLLLEKKAEVEKTYNSDALPLSVAAEHGYEEIARLLSNNDKESIDVRNNTGATALLTATKLGHAEVVKVLVAQQADINLTDWNNCSPLHFAARKSESTEILEVLLSKDPIADIENSHGYTPLLIAILSSNAAAVKLLADHGADVNQYYKNHITPLALAAQRGNGDVIRALLEANADVSLRATDIAKGLTPMMIAVGWDHADLSVGKLLQSWKWQKYSTSANHGNKSLGRDRNETTAATHAAHQPDPNSTTVKRVINLHDRDSIGMTAVMYAAQEHNSEFLKLLLRIDRPEEMVNLQDNRGRTALHIAAMDTIDSYRDNQLETISSLFEHGADVSIEDNEGRTALHYAAEDVTENKRAEQQHVLSSLIEHGASVNAIDSAGKTALHYAVLNIASRDTEEQIQVIKLLISKGANVNIQDNANKTPVNLTEEQIANENVPENSGNISRVLSQDIDDVNDKVKQVIQTISGVASKVEAKTPYTNSYKMDNGSLHTADHNIKCRKEWENTQHRSGNTDVHMLAIIEQLHGTRRSFPLHNFEDFRRKNKEGRTPLSLAAINRNIDFLKVLDSKEFVEKVKNGQSIIDDDGKTTLHLAASYSIPYHPHQKKRMNGHDDQVDLIHHLVNVSDECKYVFNQIYKFEGSELTAKDKAGNTALHCACLALNVEAVEILIRNRKLLSIINDIGWTPIHCAIGTTVSPHDAYASRQLIDKLLNIKHIEQQKAFHIRDKRSNSLLHLAVQTDRANVIPQLMQLNPELLNLDGYSPLHLAALHASTDTLTAVLRTFYSTNPGEFFRDVDHATGDGTTALLICINNGTVDKIKLLLQYGANLSRRGNDGIAVMHQIALAMAGGRTAIKRTSNRGTGTLAVILEHAVHWWCLQRNRLQEVHPKYSSAYRSAYRQAVTELTCHMRYKGQNALQFAASNDSFNFLEVVMNAPDVFMKDSGDEVSHYVAYMVPNTMPTTASSSMLQNCKVKKGDRNSSENRRDEISVLERIVNCQNAEDASNALNHVPFNWLIAPYWKILQFIYFVMLLLHLGHMIAFTLCSLPSNSWLHDRFPDVEYAEKNESYKERVDYLYSGEADVVNYSAASENWYWGLFIIWPCFNFLSDIFNAVLQNYEASLVEQTKILSTQTESGDSQDEEEQEFEDGDTNVAMKSECCRLAQLSLQFSNLYVAIENWLPIFLYSLAFLSSTIAWFVVYCYSESKQAYLISTAIVLVIGWIYILSFLTIFRSFMTLVGVLRRIILRDIIRFAVVYGFVLVSFSLAFYVLSMQTSAQLGNSWSTFVATVYTVFLQMLGMETIDVLNIDSTSITQSYLWFIRGLFVVYVSISAIVFLNLLIAMMSDTYEDAVADAKHAIKADSLRMLGRIMWLERRVATRPLRLLLQLLRPRPGLKKLTFKQSNEVQWKLKLRKQHLETEFEEEETIDDRLRRLESKMSLTGLDRQESMIVDALASLSDRMKYLSEHVRSRDAMNTNSNSPMDDGFKYERSACVATESEDFLDGDIRPVEIDELRLLRELKPNKLRYVVEMKIILRLWRDRHVLGGLKVSYNTEEIVEYGGNGGDLGDIVHEFSLRPEERITRITVRYGWLVDSLLFFTNQNRSIGPFGGHGGYEDEFRPSRPGGFLAGFNLTVRSCESRKCIRNFAPVWAVPRKK